MEGFDGNGNLGFGIGDLGFKKRKAKSGKRKDGSDRADRTDEDEEKL